MSSATRTRASLPTVVVLPVPLTPTTRMTAGRLDAGRGDRAVHARVDEGEQVGAQPAAHGLLVAGALDLDLGAQRVDQLHRRLDAEVGGQQRVLDVLPRLLVQAAAGQQPQQALAEGAVGAGQAGPQALQPAAGRGRALEERRSRAGSASSTSGARPGRARGGASRVPTPGPSASRRGRSAARSGRVVAVAPAGRRQLLWRDPRLTKQADDVRHEHDRDEDADGDDFLSWSHGAHPCTVAAAAGRRARVSAWW